MRDARRDVRVELRSLGSVGSTKVIPSVDSQCIRVKGRGQKKKLLISEGLCHVALSEETRKNYLLQMHQR